MKQKNNITSGFVTLIFAVVAVFGSIAGLKQCTGRYNVVQSNDTLPMAHPVTSLDPEIIPEPAKCCQFMKPQRAIIKVARKLACKAYAVVKTQKAYVLS